METVTPGEVNGPSYNAPGEVNELSHNVRQRDVGDGGAQQHGSTRTLTGGGGVVPHAPFFTKRPRTQPSVADERHWGSMARTLRHGAVRGRRAPVAARVSNQARRRIRRGAALGRRSSLAPTAPLARR